MPLPSKLGIAVTFVSVPQRLILLLSSTAVGAAAVVYVFLCILHSLEM